MSRALLLPLLVPLILVGACNDGDSDTAEDVDVSGARYALHPAVGGQGVSDLDITLSSSLSTFEFAETWIDLGEGITVNDVTVRDGYTAVANVSIAEDATLGLRDASLTIGRRDLPLTDAFQVIAESLTIDPDNGKMGETVDVLIQGTATEWESGYTWLGFGTDDDIEVIDFTVISESLAEATIAIRPDARPGPHDVTMEDGPSVTTLYDGFRVDRAVITAVFDPPEAYQGERVDFTITGIDTSFASDAVLEFWDDGGENSDIAVEQLTVLDNKNMYGRMRLSNAARLGYRDVYIASADERILVPDAFEVLDAPPDLSNVAVALAFDVTRAIDNDTGEISESVYGQAIFYIPLDPPCGSSSQGDGPKPYDQNGVFPVPDPPPEEDCPFPETVSAGDYVWFESDANVVTLHKDYFASYNMTYYRGIDLTLDDYQFDQLYDLHTQGDPEGVPEVIVEEVQPTVPADFEILSPELWGDFTWPRTSDFQYEWTPAETYPDAIFGTQISGVLVETGEGGFAGSIPWDDGVHTYTASELSQLEATPVTFGAYSYIEGPYFGLPFSTIQTNQSDSTLSISAQMALE